jgi:serine/threonine protein kinase
MGCGASAAAARGQLYAPGDETRAPKAAGNAWVGGESARAEGAGRGPRASKQGGDAPTASGEPPVAPQPSPTNRSEVSDRATSGDSETDGVADELREGSAAALRALSAGDGANPSALEVATAPAARRSYRRGTRKRSTGGSTLPGLAEGDGEAESELVASARGSLDRSPLAGFVYHRVLTADEWAFTLLASDPLSSALIKVRLVRKAALVRRWKAQATDRVQKEVWIYSNVQHAALPGFAFAHETPRFLALAWSYAPSSSLAAVVEQRGPFSEKEVKFLMAELVSLVDHLHRASIVHRGISPFSLHLSVDGHLLVDDLSFAVRLHSKCKKRQSVTGDRFFRAPEMLQDSPLYGFSVDWWSAGALMYFLLTGTSVLGTAVGRANSEEAVRRLRVDELRLPDSVHPPARSLLAKLLEPDPKKRLGGGSRSGGRDVQLHGFFSGVNWLAVDARQLPMRLSVQMPSPDLGDRPPFASLAEAVSHAETMAAATTAAVASNCGSNGGKHRGTIGGGETRLSVAAPSPTAAGVGKRLSVDLATTSLRRQSGEVKQLP